MKIFHSNSDDLLIDIESSALGFSMFKDKNINLDRSLDSLPEQSFSKKGSPFWRGIWEGLPRIDENR